MPKTFLNIDANLQLEGTCILYKASQVFPPVQIENINNNAHIAALEPFLVQGFYLLEVPLNQPATLQAMMIL